MHYALEVTKTVRRKVKIVIIVQSYDSERVIPSHDKVQGMGMRVIFEEKIIVMRQLRKQMIAMLEINHTDTEATQGKCRTWSRERDGETSFSL